MIDTKAAIQDGDVDALRRLLADDPSRANALIRWGRNDCIETHPLHYVSDMLFEGTLEKGRELPLVEALIEAGADVNFHKPAEGETPLMGAASLGAEDVGLRLLDAGATVDFRGSFGETPLHWAATMGLDRLVGRMIERGADVNLRDRKYDSPPLGWTLHGWRSAPEDSVRRFHAVVVRLVAAGASVEPEWLDSGDVRADLAMLSALRGQTASR